MTINVDAKSQDIPSLLDKGQRQMETDSAEGIEFEELIAKEEEGVTGSEEELAEVEELDDHADWLPVEGLMASSMLTSPHNMKLRLALEEKGGALTAESDDLSEVASDTHPQQLRADAPHALDAESQRFNLNKQLMEELQKDGFAAIDEMPADMDAEAQQTVVDAKLKAALQDTLQLQSATPQAVQTETSETIDLVEADDSGIDTVTSMDSRTAVNAETSGDSSRFSENSAEQESSEHEGDMSLSEGEGLYTDSARPTSEMSQSHSAQHINTNALDTLSIVRENGTINQVSQVVYTTQQSLETGETKTLTLSLNPSELGQVNIELQSTGESTLIAKLHFERPETLAAFQSDVSQLKDILSELGIQDTQLDLQLSMDQGKQQFSGDQHPEYTSWEEREALLARDSTASPAESEPAHPTLTRSGYTQKRNTHLDVRA